MKNNMSYNYPKWSSFLDHTSDDEKRFVRLLIQRYFEEHYELQLSQMVTLFYHISDEEKKGL